MNHICSTSHTEGCKQHFKLSPLLFYVFWSVLLSSYIFESSNNQQLAVLVGKSRRFTKVWNGEIWFGVCFSGSGLAGDTLVLKQRELTVQIIAKQTELLLYNQSKAIVSKTLQFDQNTEWDTVNKFLSTETFDQ